MHPRLFAFDLDGTLLNSQKDLSAENIKALHEIAETGIIIALASGRISGSMIPYVDKLNKNVALLTLNGAVVYENASNLSDPVYDIPLPYEYADFLIRYAYDKSFALNYYLNEKLYAVKQSNNHQWYDLYYEQTSSEYSFVQSFDHFTGKTPSKIIFIGNPEELDFQEEYFKNLWGDSIYICRTWDYYLEFLNIKANKGSGIEALANAFNIELSQIVAFGDAPNDIPMLEKVGLGIAMKNADPQVKSIANRVSSFTNDENGIAREWEVLKNEFSF